nr:alpha/beta-hydrolase family protein [Rhodococcus sp. HNM0569]
MLPRSAVVQGFATALCGCLALCTLALVRRVPLIPHVAPRQSARVLTLLAAAVAVAAGMLAADHWQDGLRRAMGLAPVGPGHWIGAILVATATFVCAVAAARAARALGRRVGPLGAVATATAVALCAYGGAGAVAPGPTDPGPVPAAYTGEAETWSALGEHGRRFVTAHSDGGRDGVRVYLGLTENSDAPARARAAVGQLDGAHGFARSAVVVAVPTGSGWVDENALEGFEERFDGDVAIVAMQYTAAPSWVSYLFQRSAADDSATALLDAVAARIAQLPPDRRPDLYVYGQSLGAVGGSTALAASTREVCGALWAGPPTGSTLTAGGAVLANSSDPVIRWTPALAVRPPVLPDTTPDAPVPGWLPGISFVQTTIDLLTALDVPAGHGHRYGDEQGLDLPGCAHSVGTDNSPRAASYAAPTR